MKCIILFISLLCLTNLVYSSEKDIPSNHLFTYTNVIMGWLRGKTDTPHKTVYMEFTICMGDPNHQVHSPDAQKILKEVALINDDDNKICNDIRAALEAQKKIDREKILAAAENE